MLGNLTLFHRAKSIFSKILRKDRYWQKLLLIEKSKYLHNHCEKSVLIRSYAGPYFPAFGLNTERYKVFYDSKIDKKRNMKYLSVFSPNAGKYGTEQLRTRTLFTQ